MEYNPHEQDHDQNIKMLGGLNKKSLDSAHSNNMLVYSEPRRRLVHSSRMGPAPDSRRQRHRIWLTRNRKSSSTEERCWPTF